MITPSAYWDIFFACSGFEMPKPIQQGQWFSFLIGARSSLKSVVISERISVTPSEDTTYRKPFDFSAIIFTRSCEVGATRNIV